MANVKEMLEEAIASAFDSAAAAEPGSPEHNARTDEVCKLYKLYLEEGKNETDAIDKANKQEIEIKKIEIDAKQKREESIRDMIRTGTDFGKAILFVVANGFFMRSIMKFEETGNISTKAFSFLGKPKIF